MPCNAAGSDPHPSDYLPSSHLVGPNITPQPYMTGLPMADMIELPHSCSNGDCDDISAAVVAPLAAAAPPPQQWLCDGTLLCLLDSKHSENITAFQRHWKRGEVCVDWTHQGFAQDAGEGGGLLKQYVEGKGCVSGP